MGRLSAIASDLQKESEGIWMHFDLGITVKIARAGNPTYRECLQKMLDPHREEIKSDTVDKDMYENLLKEARAKTVVKDWKGMTEDDDKTVIPYSWQKCLEIFKDEKFKDFYVWVVAVSESSAHYRVALVKEMEGNLPDTSDGSDSGVK